MSYKRLTQKEWTELEHAAYSGTSNSELARRFGISEGAVRKRIGSRKAIKVERAAAKIVEMRHELDLLPPELQIRAFCVADALTNISRNLTLSAELVSKTSHRLAAMAEHHASTIDNAKPNPDTLRLVHGLIETSNKAATQPIELLKAVKGSIVDQTPEEVQTVDPEKISSGALHEVLAARRSLQLS